MKRVLYTSPYVPGAWIAAHGCEPVRLRPQGDRLHASVARVEGLCPYAQAWVSDVLLSDRANAIVMTTCCDQMRRAFEVVTKQSDLPCFLLNLPSVWQTDSAFGYYQAELRRLGRFLETLGGSRVSEERLRSLLIQTKKAVVSPHEEIDRIPLALLGSHGLVQDERLKVLIERMGGAVVSDGTEPSMPQFHGLTGNAFDAMSRAYWGLMEDVFQRPNTRLYDRMARWFEQTPVKGVILRRYLWCDLWHAEVPRIKAWAPVPVLDIEISSPAHTDHHRLATRIQAFMEMIA
jgi:benzoyl-CoA reductase/2-hydroxyglutaryl-CoA dehydratase subunit BcrC/BadD/HgdB